jgi:hypothetical protein
VTRQVCEKKFLKNGARHIFGENQFITYTEKKVAQITANSAIFKKLPKVRNRPNGRKFARSGHTGHDPTQ